MKCPYCNFELTFCDQTVADKQVAVCRNPECKYTGWHLPVEIFDELNAGKCAAHNLSVVREQFDRGYNTWVRSDNDLRQKLKQAQDALNKISEIKENVEGCCAEIQQNLLPEPPLTSDEKKINSEVDTIDKYMSEIDKIITDTKEQ